MQRYDFDREQRCGFRENPHGDFISYHDYMREKNDIQALAKEALWALKHRDMPLQEIDDYIIRQREIVAALRAIAETQV